MSLVPSLLQAIVTTDGEALVLHVGEKPYVVTPTGQIDLASRGLTFAAVDGIVNEILPVESQRALDEFGAVQYELPSIVEFPGELFTIVAARGGDDLWAEIRRKAIPELDRVPPELFGAAPVADEPPLPHVVADDTLEVPEVPQLWTVPSTSLPPLEVPVEPIAPPRVPPAAMKPAPAAAHVPASPPPPSAPVPARATLPLIPPPPRDATPDVMASVTAQLKSPIAPTASAPVDVPPLVAVPAPAAPAPPAAAKVVVQPQVDAPPVVVAPSPVVQAPVVMPPVAAALPVAAAPPVVTELSVETEPSVVTESPFVVESPFVAAPPIVIEPPVVEEPPVVTASPAVTEAPVVAEPPIVTEPPVVAAPPVISERPVLPPPITLPPLVAVPPPFAVPPAAVLPPVAAPPLVIVPTPVAAPPVAHVIPPLVAQKLPPPFPELTPVAPSVVHVQPPPVAVAQKLPPPDPEPPVLAFIPEYAPEPLSRTFERPLAAEPLPPAYIPAPPAYIPPRVAQIPQEPPSAFVRPIARNPIRPDVPAPLVADALAGLDRLLRLAAARGASTLYLSSSARPTLRVDGDIQLIEGTPVLSANDVEALLMTLMPERNAEALRTGVTSEWICDVAEVGRVRCMTFSDHRGPGGVFRMLPLRTVTAEQLNLSRQIQGLALEPEGLVLIAGPRQSGKRTLMSALVDLINRTRREHVIIVETEINVMHDRVGSFVSQREVRGGRDDMLATARAALREDPDVLVLEDVRTAGLMSLALDAAASGQLVIGGLPAHHASGAVDRIIDMYPPEYRREIQLSLAQNLRGVVAQVLLKKIAGGRVAAREVLLSTPAVRGLLAEGRTSQLPLAIESGRPYGMVPLNDALVGFVQTGAVDVREAYARAVDRTGFLALLKRQGLDTSQIDRPA